MEQWFRKVEKESELTFYIDGNHLKTKIKDINFKWFENS